MGSANHHGTLVVLGEHGVFITGASGSGKTTLALALLRHCAACRRFARLVCDDQVFISAKAGRLIGRAPAAIEGLVETRGFGPAPIAYEQQSVIDLLVRLLPAATAPRLRDEERVPLEGVSLPRLDLAERQAESGVFAVAAYLSLPFA